MVSLTYVHGLVITQRSEVPAAKRSVTGANMNIRTDFNSLCHRWSAWEDDDEELTGTGDTEQEAVDQLCEKLDEWPVVQKDGTGG
jgi:hypothetical protein